MRASMALVVLLSALAALVPLLVLLRVCGWGSFEV